MAMWIDGYGEDEDDGQTCARGGVSGIQSESRVTLATVVTTW